MLLIRSPTFTPLHSVNVCKTFSALIRKFIFAPYLTSFIFLYVSFNTNCFMNKTWKIVLTIAKYVITLLLGYGTGSGDISTLLNY